MFVLAALIGAHAAEVPAQVAPALLDPRQTSGAAPERFRVRFDTTEGPFVVQVHRRWAPNAADRFYHLVRIGYYDGNRFFRAVEGFGVQFGIHGAGAAVNEVWRGAGFSDDAVLRANTRGRITFAHSARPNSSTTQLFLNTVDNRAIDGLGFAPFGEVVRGMDAVDALFTGYGEGAPAGAGPQQGLLQAQGNAYLDSDFPELDAILSATLL